MRNFIYLKRMVGIPLGIKPTQYLTHRKYSQWLQKASVHEALALEMLSNAKKFWRILAERICCFAFLHLIIWWQNIYKGVVCISLHCSACWLLIFIFKIMKDIFPLVVTPKEKHCFSETIGEFLLPQEKSTQFFCPQNWWILWGSHLCLALFG